MSVLSGGKRKIVGFVVLLIIFVFLGVLFVRELPQEPDLVAYKVEVQKVFGDAKNVFEGVRNVTLPSEIKLVVVTRQQAVDRWGNDVSGVDTASVLRRENVYKGLFLIGEDESLGGVVAEWTANWAAATVGEEVYVIYENFCPWDMPEAEAILVHELTHVWQHGLPSPTSYDEDKAYSALVEGDASYMGDYYRNQYSSSVGFEDGSYRSSLFLVIDPSWVCSVCPSVSNTVTELNWFPYVKGKMFVSALIDKGGWNKLNSCYTTVYAPTTTEQILHPDKYFGGETAKTVLGPTFLDESWTIIPSSYGCASDTFGEYFIYVMLNQWLSEEQSQQAAAGWGGDSFTYYEKDKDFLFTWNITWDSVEDASEFNQAFRYMLSFTQATPQGLNGWVANGRYITFTWNSNTKSTMIMCSSNQTVLGQVFS